VSDKFEEGNWMRSHKPIGRAALTVWTVGPILGVIAAWTTLTGLFPLALIGGAIWIGLARTRRVSAVGSFLAGFGAMLSFLTVAAASNPQPWIWFVISPAVTFAGFGVGWIGRRELLESPEPEAGHDSTDRPRRSGSVGWWPRLPAKAIIGMAVVLALGLSWTGFPAGPGEYALPAVYTVPPVWLGTMCAGVGVEATLHGDPSDPRIAWLENRLGVPEGTTGRRMDVVWPAGFRARFTPKLEVLDDLGQVVLREGDLVGGACGSPVDGSGFYYLTPPFK
jgi:hypothetical protein